MYSFGLHGISPSDTMIPYVALFMQGYISKIKNGKIFADILKNIPSNFNPADQPDKIFRYVELSNIDSSIGVIDGYSGVLGQEAPSRAKRILRTGDVIVSTVQGSLQKVALVSGEQDGYLASTGFFQLRSKEILPEVLLVLAKSPILQMQLEKQCTGTILTAVPKEGIKNLLIPSLGKSLQEKISDLVHQSHQANKKAKELLEKAKREVENIILEAD
jgi:restriction endonuclease S subunit